MSLCAELNERVSWPNANYFCVLFLWMAATPLCLQQFLQYIIHHGIKLFSQSYFFGKNNYWFSNKNIGITSEIHKSELHRLQKKMEFVCFSYQKSTLKNLLRFCNKSFRNNENLTSWTQVEHFFNIFVIKIRLSFGED